MNFNFTNITNRYYSLRTWDGLQRPRFYLKISERKISFNEKFDERLFLGLVFYPSNKIYMFHISGEIINDIGMYKSNSIFNNINKS